MVRNELSHPKAPAPVRNWIANPPEWIEFGHVSNRNILGPEFPYLDLGEKEAIFLALEIQAELLLMDDEAGVSAARNQGLEVIGTLGILSRAADRKMLDLAEAFGRLKRTNFHHSQDVMDQFLTERE